MYYWFHQALPESGLVSCVYWEDKTEDNETREGRGGEENTRHWSVEGCWVASTNENYTVCSCSHLSTFALIMQIGEVLSESESVKSHVTQVSSQVTTFSVRLITVCVYIFAMSQPPPENDFLEWLSRACVTVGLFFFALAILTFLLSSWNPKINNTARLHLCLSLSLSHLLLLWNDRYVEHEV